MTKSPKSDSEETDQQAKLPFCGIIMPIAPIGQYEKSHLDRVRTVLDEAIIDAGYSPRLVSESENIGVIHARIVQNLYDDPIVVCDVSGKNANVMFELGLRLAFNKPTIVIKDDLTDYSFDTSPIEHLNYRADLRFDDVRDFKKKLSAVIVATVEKKDSDPSYSPFLGHFGKFKVSGLETKTVSSEQFMIEQLKGVQAEISRLASSIASKEPIAPSNPGAQLISKAKLKNLVASVLSIDSPDLTDEFELYRFIERIRSEMKSLDIKLSDAAFHAVVGPLVVEYKSRKTQ